MSIAPAYEVYVSSPAGSRLIATYKTLSAARVRCTDGVAQYPKGCWTVLLNGETILYA